MKGVLDGYDFDVQHQEHEEDEEEAEEEAADETGICECINSHGQEVFFPADREAFIIGSPDGVDYEYPANYGLGFCSDWDAGLDPYCAENGEDYCEAQWCYVSSECEASDATPSNLNED